jgi:hypothetical protein
MLGAERMLAAMKEYVRRFSFQDDHPTMTDFVGMFEELYPETAPFFEQYVMGKAIPNPGFTRAERESLPDGRWRVTFEVANRGEGDLDVVVEAHEGKREEQEKREREAREKTASAAARGADTLALTSALADSARAAVGASARTVLALDGLEPATGSIVCEFRPDEIEIDPDATVLMQERKKGRKAL